MDLIYYRDVDRAKYQLARDYRMQIPLYGRSGGAPFISLDEKGWIWFAAGYLWDGPSGPTIDTPGAMRPSLVHDGMYQLIKLGVLPAEAKDLADVFLRDMYLVDGKRVVDRELDLALGGLAEPGTWFRSAREALARRRHRLQLAAIQVRAEAWFAAVQAFGSGGDQPPEKSAPF